MVQINIFGILGNLYTSQEITWIKDLDDAEIQPYLIQRWLAMNDKVRQQARWLDKYVFDLPPKMYLTLAWSVIPKTQKAPFVRYIKQADADDEFDFILAKVRKQYAMSDNDFKAVKHLLVAAIKKDMTAWFSYYGIPKRYWERYYLSFDKIKTFCNREIKKEKQGLEAWGL